MQDGTTWLVVLSTILAALVVFFATACFILTILYQRSRSSLELVIRDRDGWRGVAERALLVAQIGKHVSRRATGLASRVR